MARGKKSFGQNGFSSEKAVDYVRRIEALQGDIDSIMEDAREKCAPHREDIAGLKNEAWEIEGIPSAALNTVLRERRQALKARLAREKMTEGQMLDYESIHRALGVLADTPLGAIAMHRVYSKNPESDA